MANHPNGLVATRRAPIKRTYPDRLQVATGLALPRPRGAVETLDIQQAWVYARFMLTIRENVRSVL